MLIPSFTCLGAGVAQFIQLRKHEQSGNATVPVAAPESLPASSRSALNEAHTEFVSPESRYKTGDLIPPSVTDNTTRHLEMDSEGKTMSLPKK